jgi:DNA/RNA endonuclease YhcR with UshA esterase domain
MKIKHLSVVCLLVAGAAVAHHSQSEFDFKNKVQVEGKVTQLDWRSPHARLYLDVVNAEGETENWDFELPSPTTLMRRGWTRQAMKPGDHVTVTGVRARNFPTIGYAVTIRDAKGQALFTGNTQIYEPEVVRSEGSK